MTGGPIVAVDDNPWELELLTLCHTRAGVERPLLTFEDPDELERYVQRVDSGSEQEPAFILVDVRMGRSSGFELVERLKTHRSCTSNVALFTTSRHPDDALEAERLGVELLVKPPSLDDYVDFVRRLSVRIDATLSDANAANAKRDGAA